MITNEVWIIPYNVINITCKHQDLIDLVKYSIPEAQMKIFKVIQEAESESIKQEEERTKERFNKKYCTAPTTNIDASNIEMNNMDLTTDPLN